MHPFNVAFISVFSIVIACVFLFVCCCFCGAYYNYKISKDKISNGREHEMTSVVVVNETTRILPKN